MGEGGWEGGDWLSEAVPENEASKRAGEGGDPQVDSIQISRLFWDMNVEERGDRLVRWNGRQKDRYVREGGREGGRAVFHGSIEMVPKGVLREAGRVSTWQGVIGRG